MFKVLNPCLSIASLALKMKEDELAQFWMEKGNTSGELSEKKTLKNADQYRTAKTGSIPTRWSAGSDLICRAHRLQWLHFPVAQQDQWAGSQVERFVDSDSTSARRSTRTPGQPGRPDGGLDGRGLEVPETPSTSLLTETGRALLYCLVFRSFGNFVWDESCNNIVKDQTLQLRFCLYLRPSCLTTGSLK